MDIPGRSLETLCIQTYSEPSRRGEGRVWPGVNSFASAGTRSTQRANPLSVSFCGDVGQSGDLLLNGRI